MIRPADYYDVMRKLDADSRDEKKSADVREYAKEIHDVMVRLENWRNEMDKLYGTNSNP